MVTSVADKKTNKKNVDQTLKGGAVISDNQGSSFSGVKPLLRGRFHQVAFFLTILYGIYLTIVAPRFWPKIAMVIYTLGVGGMFGTSTLLHRGKWSPKTFRVVRRCDHAMIFSAIAGTFTAIGGLILPPVSRAVMLSLIWGGAIVGVLIRVLWMGAPRWAVITPYVAVGWIAVAVFPGLYHGLGLVGFILLIVGGLVYTLGAVVYAKKKPNPWPKVFGFHEVFHLLTVVAAIVFALDVTFVVLPRIS
jgi:hemolysin III